MSEDILYELRNKIKKDLIIKYESIPNSGKAKIIAEYHGYVSDVIIGSEMVQDLSAQGVDVEYQLMEVLLRDMIGDPKFLILYEKIQNRNRNLEYLI